MTEQTPMPDGWVGQEATIRYREVAEKATARNCIIREVNERGVGVEEGQRTAFFPWSSIVRIDLGHHARRGSTTLRVR